MNSIDVSSLSGVHVWIFYDSTSIPEKQLETILVVEVGLVVISIMLGIRSMFCNAYLGHVRQLLLDTTHLWAKTQNTGKNHNWPIRAQTSLRLQ